MKGAQLFADSYRSFTSDSGGPVWFLYKDSIFEDHIFKRRIYINTDKKGKAVWN